MRDAQIEEHGLDSVLDDMRRKSQPLDKNKIVDIFKNKVALLVLMEFKFLALKSTELMDLINFE